jgi:phage terminase small subunit
MPILHDPKRENFCQLIARGISVIDAYGRAGYKRNTGNATALKKRPDVTARIEELQYEMAQNNQSELNEYLRDSKLTPTYIIKQMLETGIEAKGAGKYDIAAKCFKDIGGELFGMFVERKHIAVDKNSVHTQTNTTINISSLNQALESLGEGNPRLIEIDGIADQVDLPRADIPLLAFERI